MTVLDDIIAGVREDLVDRQAAVDLAELQRLAQQRPSALSTDAALRDGDAVKVIAEVKRSSPSKGALAAIADPAALAGDYEAGGASVISVLTERRRFGGSLDDLAAVRAAVDVPVLRKDFIVTTYQLVEARAAGADLALLIVAALDDDTMRRLHDEARELGLTVLVEVHDEAETERAVALGAELVGVNARNLKTLQIHDDTFGRLAPLVPDDRVKVAESGIFSAADVKRFVGEGARAVLVGEALVKDGDPEAAVAGMTGVVA